MAMLPLNMAILKLFTDGKEYSRADVQDALRKDYGNFKAFKDKGMEEALQTACSNGLVGESRLEMDANGNLIVYYQSDQDMIDVINSYI
jgi:hypothetical protein